MNINTAKYIKYFTRQLYNVRCATNRKVAGSIPAGVIGNFSLT